MSSAPAATMLYLTYTPREDAARDNYEDWLREVDNPFFNSIPGIRQYTNWKAISPVPAAHTYRWFDHMVLDSADAVTEVLGNTDLQAFAANWVRRWGRLPDEPDSDENYQMFLAQRTFLAEDGPRQPYLLIRVYETEAPGPAGAPLWDDAALAPLMRGRRRATWCLTDEIKGRLSLPVMDVAHLADPAEFDTVLRARPHLAETAFVAERVATPRD
ncbi:MAG: hypothetical protein RIE22_09805 [Alphaproteobacteria bacterium]